MAHPVRKLDHALLLVDDLDAAEAHYAAMGFTLSPRGLHSAAKGSANHTIMLGGDYIELLGILAPTPLNADRRAALRHGQGLHGLAMRIGNGRQAGADLGGLGIATTTYSEFARPVTLADGGEAEARFATLLFEASEVPRGIAFMCEHRTPDLVWQADLMAHRNTATRIGEVIAVSDTPEADGAALARLLNATVSAEDGGTRLDCAGGGAAIVLMTGRRFADEFGTLGRADRPRHAYDAMRVAVNDLGAASAALERGSVPHKRTARGLAVGAAQAAGTVLEFVT